MESTMNTNGGATDVDQGKLLATLSYIIMIVALFPLLKRDNRFALYHAAQALGLFVACFAAGIALTVVSVVVAFVPAVGPLIAMVASLAFCAAAIGMIVMGVINAWNGRYKPLPFIGKYAEKYVPAA